MAMLLGTEVKLINISNRLSTSHVLKNCKLVQPNRRPIIYYFDSMQGSRRKKHKSVYNFPCTRRKDM